MSYNNRYDEGHNEDVEMEEEDEDEDHNEDEDDEDDNDDDAIGSSWVNSRQIVFAQELWVFLWRSVIAVILLSRRVPLGLFMRWAQAKIGKRMALRNCT